MKRNRFSPRFAYILMGTLLLSAGVFYYASPWGTSHRPQTTTVSLAHHVSQKSFSMGMCRVSAPLGENNARDIHIVPQTAQAVTLFYDMTKELGKEGGQCTVVPRLFSVRLPRDMRGVKNPQNRRDIFIKMVLPLILKTNEEVLAQRARLFSIAYRKKRGLPVSPEARHFLQEMAREYRMSTVSVDGLLKRIDQVPPSLALAQAILETGCGTSCAALNKHSIFGHMATLTKVQPFSSLNHSVHAYVRNLNRHKAYNDFRSIRHDLRMSNKPLSGFHLASGLLKYSIRGQAYIKDLQKLIRLYNLEQFDGAALSTKTEIA